MQTLPLLRRTTLVVLGLEIIFVLGLTAFNAYFAFQLRMLGGVWVDFFLFTAEALLISFFWQGLRRKKMQLAKWSWMPTALTVHMISLTGIFYAGFPDILYWAMFLVPPVLLMIVFLKMPRTHYLSS